MNVPYDRNWSTTNFDSLIHSRNSIENANCTNSFMFAQHKWQFSLKLNADNNNNKYKLTECGGNMAANSLVSDDRWLKLLRRRRRLLIMIAVRLVWFSYFENRITKRMFYYVIILWNHTVNNLLCDITTILG